MTYRPTGPREAELLQAANLLMDARRTMVPIPSLPEPLRPHTREEACWIQKQLAGSFAPIGGWKVGASGPEAEPLCAPMPLAFLRPGGMSLRPGLYRLREIEAEVAFLIGQDLPARTTPYSRNEVIGAIESCHPAIEILESAFADPFAVDEWSRMADLQIHGGFIYGPACADWHTIDFAQEHVSLDIDGVLRFEQTGSNPAGDLLRLLCWLAHEGAKRTDGLKRGQWVTTGSWTGHIPALEGSAVDIRFSTVGRVTVKFER